MTFTRSLALVLVSVVAQGCIEPDDVSYGEVASEVSVSTYVRSGCSTAVVLGLSRQIADEVACMNPRALTSFAPGGRLTITSNAVLPYLAPTAKTALERVTANSSIQVNSGFRTVAQQYLLYQWYRQGRCGITAAATPGRSNHQSGRALDVANYSSRITAMRNAGWSHPIPNDPVHFDHTSSPDIRGEDVLAFQRLWNRNNPNDRIDEDGMYGSDTEARLRVAPATGFARGASCNTGFDVGGAKVLSVDGPDRVAPNAHATYSITLQNTGATSWPSTTRVVVADGTASEIYDPASWTSPTEVGPINTAIPAGGTGVIDIEIETPAVTEETPVFAQLALSDGSEQFGTLNVALTVTPNGDHEQSAEAGDQHDDESAHTTGGCNAGGASSGFAALLGPMLFGLVRRRRR
jgi:hypothetical protein